MKSSPATFRARSFLAPRYWHTWIGLAIMWLVAQLPYPLLCQCGAGLGRISYYLLRKKRHIAEVNIALCFPELSSPEQQDLVKGTFRSIGIAVFETGLACWGKEHQISPLLQPIEGMEHITNALKKGNGALMLGGHFTAMLICGRLLAKYLPFYILAKKAENPLFEAVIQQHRSRYYNGVIDRKDVRSMLKTLKANQVLWYAPDQDLGLPGSVFASFMGQNATTLTTTSRLAKSSGASVIPIHFERLPEYRGYRVRFLPELDNFPSGDDTRDARRFNEMLEEQIQRIPDQYLWIHRRLKTQADGKSPYIRTHSGQGKV